MVSTIWRINRLAGINVPTKGGVLTVVVEICRALACYNVLGVISSLYSALDLDIKYFRCCGNLQLNHEVTVFRDLFIQLR